MQKFNKLLSEHKKATSVFHKAKEKMKNLVKKIELAEDESRLTIITKNNEIQDEKNAQVFLETKKAEVNKQISNINTILGEK